MVRGRFYLDFLSLAKGEADPQLVGFSSSLCGDGERIATVRFCLPVMQRECGTSVTVSSLLYSTVVLFFLLVRHQAGR